MLILLRNGYLMHHVFGPTTNILTFVPSLVKLLEPLRYGVDYVFLWDES